MQRHVHAADAQHGVVEVVAVEHPVMEMRARRRIVEQLGVLLAQVLARGHQEAAGAAGRVADGVLRRRGRQLHHQLDDVARRAELAVLAGRRDLAQHVLVEVALGVAVLHRHMVQHVHHLGQQAGRGDGEARILHVLAVGGAVAATRQQAGAQEGKHTLAHHGEHLGRREVLEARPAQVVVAATCGVLALGEDALVHRALEQEGLAFFQRVRVIQAADEQQVGDLFQHLHRVGDAAGPEGVPDGVDLAADFASEHACTRLLDHPGGGCLPR